MGTTPARVTIAVPVHNGERYLGEALASIAAQSYPDWEAVVVDDASTDSSLELAQRFARDHPRVKVISLPRNVGVGEARNIAIRAASGGELVALLDQDDYWREHYLERSVELYDAAVATGRRPGIVACNGEILTVSGPDGTYADRYRWREQIDYDAMIKRNHILARALFSRPAFDDVGGFDPTCLTADDYDLWLRMLEAGYTIVTTRESLAVYRVHEDNQSRDQTRFFAGTLAAYSRALERGRLSPQQRRAVRFQIRHYRALQERARARTAIAERRWADACVRSMRAAPLGLVAFLQAPGRWREWVGPTRSLRRTRPA